MPHDPKHPRIPRGPLTVNEDLLNQYILHAHDLERLNNGQVRKILRYLNRYTYPKILGKVSEFEILNHESWQGFLKSGNPDFRRLQAEMREIISQGINRALELHAKDLVGIQLSESNWAVQSIRLAVPVQMRVEPPSSRLREAWARSRPMQGKYLKDWFKELASETQARVSATINQGLVQGQSIDQITRSLRGTRATGFTDGVLQVSRRQAETIVRTSTAHALAEAREMVFEENKDVLKGYQWVATLDSSTCVLCSPNDGREFKRGEGERPPLHPNCRCTMVPVVKSWEELGFKSKRPRLKDKRTRFARNYDEAGKAMRGEVPGSMTYPDWLRSQPQAIQNRALGKRKAELWREGRISIDRFKRDNRILSLEQLEKLGRL